MHPYFSVMDERWFHRAFVYTGSVTDREKNLDFRYRYEQVKGDDGDALKASTYSDLCYELAQDVEEETLSLIHISQVCSIIGIPARLCKT